MADILKTLGLAGAFRPIQDRGARIGVVDVGSNSVRMVVFDGAIRSPAIFYNEKVLCGLGEELSRTGRLSESGKQRALLALKRFKALAEGIGQLQTLDIVGTAALRDAEDGPEFVAQVERDLKISMRVASGADEARLSAQGVMVGEPDANGVVADIGGASMELIELQGGKVGEGVTTPLGPLRLRALSGDADTSIDSILEEAATLPDGSRRFAPDCSLYIVGGSWRSLVKAHMAEQNYPLRVLHGFSLPSGEAREMADWGARLTVEKLRALTKASERRAAVTPGASRVLGRLIRRLRPSRVTLSAFGLREGVLWEHLPAPLRDEDPLLQPCAMIERSHSRRPGFGEELWRWLYPVLPELADPADARLAKAACLLSDASWRTHPDYRARTNFELVTRNNFGGVDHLGRVFIGVALLHRYKNGGAAMEAEPAAVLLPRPRRDLARALGRGVRLGAMLGASSAGVLPVCPLQRDEEGLTLVLTGRAVDLAGEELEKRLKALANALRLERAKVRIG
ncbi:MAG: Ppx/GppA family phosphatase [Rhodobacteraceae bacterium]|nr:Ppx/GppA family phosphatase [Paracoccaceae bacterium]